MVLEIKNICKDYYIFNNPSEVFISKLTKNNKVERYTALKDISFNVYKGETLGIVGHNGSGKSTLLQIITGVLQPTSGEVKCNLRIAALLELGSGFNPEFTGLENIYYNATILGLEKSEIDRRLDSIIKFAGIGEFVHRQVKTYSSGMMLRLAFSVIINIDPEILIIDEALAVGDDAFQRKCFSRLQELQNKGVTIIFVSHAAGQVIELCDRAILLDHGEMLANGNPKSVIDSYHKLLHMEDGKKQTFKEQLRLIDFSNDTNNTSEIFNLNDGVQPESDSSQLVDMDDELVTTWYGERGAQISNPRILNSQGKKVNVLSSRNQYHFCYDIVFSLDSYHVSFGMMIKTIQGLELGGNSSHKLNELILEQCKKGSKYTVSFDFECNLSDGTYFMNAGCLGMYDGSLEYLHRGVDVLSFKVIENSSLATGLIDFKSILKVKNIH
ncbi:ABC transporter ATP-binding protein [Vibrio echinoideorum]|uniref:ABC transporter ATP-binding protein n=1 Tax=Vibrio echinoideorum TaxID=2100116 RepID=UPI001081F37D|nr:ABC transporter ATP-binding protein [Vibrio echinoideorum]